MHQWTLDRCYWAVGVCSPGPVVWRRGLCCETPPLLCGKACRGKVTTHHYWLLFLPPYLLTLLPPIPVSLHPLLFLLLVFSQTSISRPSLFAEEGAVHSWASASTHLISLLAVLTQIDDEGGEHSVAYYSRKLLPWDERYSTIEQECLAIKLGVQAFRVYLFGKPFVVQTDHRLLEWLDRLKDDNSRLSRWSLALQPFQFRVEHRPGKANSNADALSRKYGETWTSTLLMQEKGGGVWQIQWLF